MSAVTDILFASIPAAIALGAGGAQYLEKRRTGSGRIRTSEASIVWQQAQDMRATLLAEKNRAEDQRDKLLEFQRTQTRDGVEILNQSLSVLTETVAELVTEVRQALGERGTH